MLKMCLNKQLAQQNSSCDILVVDNASTDDTAEAIKALADCRIQVPEKIWAVPVVFILACAGP